jgi:hypothetical protein
MKIRKLLSNMFSFLIHLRGSGTTTLIQKVAYENDVWVLVPNEQMKKKFGESGVTFDELDRIKDCKPKPILLDNYTLLQLSELSLNEYERLDLMIKKRNRLIRTSRDEINLFERENGITHN